MHDHAGLPRDQLVIGSAAHAKELAGTEGSRGSFGSEAQAGDFRPTTINELPKGTGSAPRVFCSIRVTR